MFLDVNGDLSQLAVGTIEAAGLGLMVDGTIVLNEANDVDVLAIDSQGAAQFNDVNDIMVGSVSIEAVSANRAMFAMNGTVDAASMSIAGISTPSSLSLVADGNIFQDQPVVVGGDAVLDAGTGDVVLTEANDFNRLEIVSSSIAEIFDVNDLTVTDATVADTIRFEAGELLRAGDIATALGVDLQSGGGLVTGDVSVVSGDINIDSGDFLEAGNLSADNVTVVAEGDANIGEITASGDVTVESNWEVRLTSVDGTTATIDVGTNLSVGAINTTSDTTITAGDSIEVDSIVAGGSALLQAVGRVSTQTVDAALVEINAGTSQLAGQVTAGTATLTAAENLTVGTVTTVNDATLVAGTGNLTADVVESNAGAIDLSSLRSVNVGEVDGSGDVTVNSGLQVNSDLIVSSAGSVTVDAGANLSARVVDAAVDVTLNAPASNAFSDSVIAGGSVNLNSGFFLFTRNIEAPEVFATAGTNQNALRVIADTAEITAVGDLRVNEIQADQLTLEAGDDINDARFLDGLGITTDSLVVRAGNSNDELTFGGIVLETDVNNLSATVDGTGFGNIVIVERDAIVLGDVVTGDGRVTIEAGGTISGGSIETRIDDEQNDIRLIASGSNSDIRVDQIDAGSEGDVFLIADDDVIISGAGNEVVSDFLFVSARNLSAGGTNGIVLSSNAARVSATVGNVNDPVLNPGGISITDASDLELEFARTQFGEIDVTSNGTLVASNVQAGGVDSAEAIRLAALGNGSDVVVGRVAVAGQAGGIVLTADDDVRDSDLEDTLCWLSLTNSLWSRETIRMMHLTVSVRRAE